MSITCDTGSILPNILNQAGWPRPQYANPAWYRTGGGQPKLFEQWALCVQPGENQPGAVLSVCDITGNCMQQNSANPAPSVATDVDAASAMVQHLTASDRSTQVSAAGGPGANITIQTPVADTVLSTTEPISITGSASSYLSLKAITVTVDGTPVYTNSYLAHAITSTNFAVDWTPTTEGAHILQAEAADWGPDSLYTIYLPIMLQTGSIGTANAAETQSALPIKPQVFSTSEPITIYLDLTPPMVDLGSTVFTRTAYAPPSVRFSGSVTDALGLSNVIVEVGNSALTANTDQADQWTADWPVDASALPDGVTYPITATAIDRAGHLTTDVITGVIDVVGPNVQPSITIDDQPLVADLWITQTAPHTYTLMLPPATDGSGVAGYWFGYTLGPTFTLDMLEFVPYESDALTLTRAITLPNDGQALYLHVVAYDTLGNDTTQTFGPVYLDTPVTPDYISMNEPSGPYQGLPYRQWMDNSCSYLGQDLRVPMRAQPGAALAEAQKLYATWDHTAMRITWSGADWNRDGDLFVYFDTIPDQMPDYPGTIPYVRHGSHVAYNPYAATMNSTLMLLPVQEWSSIPEFFPDLWPDLNRMNADYAVWVENDTTLHLLQWDDGSQQWTEIALPDTATFNFSTDTGTPLTEFYLPLDVVSATIGSQVNLVAFASDDDALRVWSVLPSTNPASSSKVVANAVPNTDPFQFMLTDRYSVTLDDGDCRTSAYRTWLKVSPEPGGLAYTARDDEVRLVAPRFSAFSGAYSKVFQGYYTILDELVSRIDEPYQSWLTNTFCPANRYHPACGGTSLSLEEKLASYQDVDFSPLEPGERVTYTVHYINEQPIAKTFRSWFMSQPLDSIVWDEQPWVYGCPGWLDVTLPAKSEGDLTLTGEVVTFTQKVNLKFDPPETLAPNCSAGGIKPTEPYNNLTVYYSTDTQGPSYIAIDEPRSIIGQNTTTLRGTVIDASPVPTITLEFSVDGSPAQSTTCVNPTPSSQEWNCALDIGAQVGGSLVDVRAQATDQFGNIGNFSPWLTLMVDTQAPTTSVDVRTQDALADGVIGPSETALSGFATDDHLLSGVEVCSPDDVCTQATTTLDPLTVPQTTHVYDDAPDTPIAIAANSGLASTAPSGVNVPNVCGPNTVGIWHTFSVTDDFVVADVQLGLNITHPQRSDLLVKLWGWGPGAPAIDVIDFGANVNAPNLDVLLTAATDQSVTAGREAQDVAQPYYDTVRLPSTALSAFKGRSAAGLWTLVICDTNPAADEGAYNRAQLILKAFTLPQGTVGSWQYTFSFTDSVDGALQTLNVFGYDSVGNREGVPQTLTFMADNVAPVLVVTQTETALGLFTLVQPIAFTGIVSDGAGVQSVMVTSYSPSGQVKIEAATIADGGANLGTPGASSAWEYALTPLEVGKYTVTVVATDRAGNSISADSYEVNVLDVALGSHRTYLPLLARNTAVSVDQSESKRTLSMPDNEVTKIAMPIVSVLTNLFQWLAPSP